MTGPAIHTRGDERAVALAGLNSAPADAKVVVGLGAGVDADVVWLEGSADGHEQPGGRVIAQGGPGLWRRAPWPARDELFELAAPAGRTILLVGMEEQRRELAEYLDRPTGGVRSADVLERGALEEAAIVVFAQAPDEPLPAAAPAVLAAGRVLVLRRPSVAFGLLAGVDHLAARTAAGVAELAMAATLHWEALHSVRAFGRVAAEAHRASTVYARVACDVLADR